ncbi:hypothetical protein [Enterococcus phage vB_Efm8_KEN21]
MPYLTTCTLKWICTKRRACIFADTNIPLV